MVVVKCGASGHNIRSRPGLNAAPVGKLALGNMVTIQEYVSVPFESLQRIDFRSNITFVVIIVIGYSS